MTKYKIEGYEFTLSELKAYCEKEGYYLDLGSIPEPCELENCEILNPTNRQQTIFQIIDIEDQEYHKAQIMLQCTTQYHNFRDTISDLLINMLYEIANDQLNTNYQLTTEDIEDYNRQVDIYNKYGDAIRLVEGMNILDAIAQIEQTSRQSSL